MGGNLAMCYGICAILNTQLPMYRSRGVSLDIIGVPPSLSGVALESYHSKYKERPATIASGIYVGEEILS